MRRGLQLKNVDLHTHTPASPCYASNDTTPEEFVQAAIANGLDVIAVTDHHSGAWIDRVKEAAAGKGLTVFPGVEVSTEGFHIVALFDVDKGSDHVTSFLGAIDITPELQGKPDTVCQLGAAPVLEKISEHGGLAVLAHIDDTNGAFRVLEGLRRITLFNKGSYHAVESTTGSLPELMTSNVAFRRRPACYMASDNPDPDNPVKHSAQGLGARRSYFRLEDNVTLEGIRQCFADPDVRIDLGHDRNPTPVPQIVSLAVTEGFLNHQRIRFHSGLNSIIGGTGVGKSLIIEFLRYALEQPSSRGEVAKDHGSKLEKRLGRGGRVEVVVKLPSGREYQIARTFGGASECMDLETSEPYGGDVAVLFPILAYSQMEVIDIARDESAQLELIDSFLDLGGLQHDVAELAHKLKENDRKLSEAIRASYEAEALMREANTIETDIQEIDRQLKRDGDSADIIAQYELAREKAQALDAVRMHCVALCQDVEDCAVRIEARQVPQPSAMLDKDPDVTWAVELARVVQAALAASVRMTRDTMGSKSPELQAKCASCEEELRLKREQYDATMAQRKEDQERAAKKSYKQNELAHLKEKMSVQTALADGVTALDAEREALLNQYEAVHRSIFEMRERLFAELTTRSAGKLRLELRHAENKQEFLQELKQLLQGSGARIADQEAVARSMTVRRFANTVRERAIDQLKTEADITENGARTIVERVHSFGTLESVLRLQYACYPTDVPSIQYRKDDSIYAPLSELSVGQKCTALLIIALSEGTRPIIIDQPEDALDIATVWEDVSLKLREHKARRQFILTTHNASVAVASDSDMFIIVKASAEQASVKSIGAIEHPEVKPAVIQLLEGGEEPYKLRNTKYNIRPLN